MGCLLVAVFKRDEGLIYGADGCIKFFFVQLLGAVAILCWTTLMSGSFFLISEYSGILKVSEKAEVLGGDIFYFAPIKF